MPADAVPSLRVHHLAVKVRDLARAEVFYTEALGLPVMRRQVDEAGAPRSIWVALGEPGTFLAIERAEDDAPGRVDPSPGWHCVALGIQAAEREAWRARLTVRGFPIVRETAFTLYVRDPEGAIVALSHYPHPVAEAVVTAPNAAANEPVESPIDVGPDAAAEATSAGVTSRLAALVTLSIVLLAFGFGATLARTHAQSRSRQPADVLLIGSSSVYGPFGRLLAERFAEAGLRVSRVCERSTGLARPDFYDWQAQVPRLGDLSTLRGVIVYMGGNDTQALRARRGQPVLRVEWNDEAAWRRAYAERTHTFVESLCERGARRVAVILPTDGEREGFSERIGRVQEAQAEGVRGTSCGVIIDPRVWQAERGDTTDGVHLTTRAVRELLMHIGPALLAAISG